MRARPADRNANDRIFTQAAVQGIGFYFSSGDSGDESNSGYGGPSRPPTSRPPRRS